MEDLTQEQEEKRKEFIIEKFRANPEFGIEKMRKLVRTELKMPSLEFYSMRDLKVEALGKKRKTQRKKGGFKTGVNLKSVETNGHACPKELKSVMKELEPVMRALQLESVTLYFGSDGSRVKYRKVEEADVPGPS